MKLFAFDGEGIADCNPWKKCWASLGDIEPLKCTTDQSLSEAERAIGSACRSSAVILLVHQSECSLAEELVTDLVNRFPSLFVMYVTGGNQEQMDRRVCPRIHYSKRIVPTGNPLGYLKKLFSNLSRNLEGANGDVDRIKAAWDEWEFPVVDRLLSVLSPLVLVPKAGTLADAVADHICKNLRQAVSELNSSDPDEEALARCLRDDEMTGPKLVAWLKEHPQALINLAQRSL